MIARFPENKSLNEKTGQNGPDGKEMMKLYDTLGTAALTWWTRSFSLAVSR